jgi:hypothetical protein
MGGRIWSLTIADERLRFLYVADERPTVSANVRALEALLGRLRVLGSELFDLDAFDRWGPKSGPQYEQFIVDDVRAQSAHKATEAELGALVTRLRHDDPDAVVQWADAHDTLLRSFIATCTGAAENTRASTAAFVAKEELRAWAAVKSGAQPFVEENTYYVPVDPELHRALFGDGN